MFSVCVMFEAVAETTLVEKSDDSLALATPLL